MGLKITQESNLSIGDKDILLRGGTDKNHGIGWYGAGKLFAGSNVDDPAVYGWSGGALGTTADRQKIALSWNSAGNVGIGTATPQAKLQITDGAIMPAVGNSSNAGIQFPSDPGGGGDQAFIRYFVESGEKTKLRIGIENDTDDTIGLWQMGEERMTIYNGNVGIGTTAPQGTLDVNGNIKIRGSAPFMIKQYGEFRNDKDNSFDTGVLTNTWNAVIAGFKTGKGDINEGYGTIFYVYMKERNAQWTIFADFNSEEHHEGWTVWVLFIRKELCG